MSISHHRHQLATAPLATRNGETWTLAEVTTLQTYAAEGWTLADIAELMGRTFYAVQTMSALLARDAWTPADDARSATTTRTYVGWLEGDGDE